MTAINDICDSIIEKIKAIVPEVRSGVPFRERLTTERLVGSSKDTGFERSFRVLPGSPFTQKTFGGSMCEVETVLLIEVGYLAAQDDKALRKQMAADAEQIHVALQASGLSWPARLANIFVYGEATTNQAGQGDNYVVMSWPWKVIYDIGT